MTALLSKPEGHSLFNKLNKYQKLFLTGRSEARSSLGPGIFLLTKVLLLPSSTKAYALRQTQHFLHRPLARRQISLNLPGQPTLRFLTTKCDDLRELLMSVLKKWCCGAIQTLWIDDVTWTAAGHVSRDDFNLYRSPVPNYANVRRKRVEPHPSSSDGN